jgi:ABC-type bacteriocin/lantibiotic exporter with double-glycine peptidase domain
MRKFKIQFLLTLIALINTFLVYIIIDNYLIDINFFHFLLIEFMITAAHAIYNKFKKDIILNYFSN